MSSMRRVWAGLESVGNRPMSQEIRERLAMRAERLRYWLFLGLVGPFVSAGLAVGLIWLLPSIVVIPAFFSGFMIGPAVSLLVARDASQRRTRLLRDLAGGEVETFRGQFATAIAGDPVYARLMRRGELAGRIEGEREVQILPASAYLYSIDDVARDDFLVPDVLEVATPSADESPFGAGETQRDIALSAGERSELSVRATRFWRTPLVAFGTVAYASLGVVMWAARSDHASGAHAIQTLLWFGFGLASAWSLVKRYRTARALGRDAERGEATMRVETDDAGVSRRVVVLRESNMIWSVDGLPAEWRSKSV